MKAAFDGQDYLIFLNGMELIALYDKKLEMPLKQQWGTEDLGKLVTIEVGENNGCDGIELKYFPEDGYWDDIKEVRIKLNESAYWTVRSRGQFGTRYNGSDKVEIVNEEKL